MTSNEFGGVIDVNVEIVEQLGRKIIGMSIHTLLHETGETGPALHAKFEERLPEIRNRVNPSIDYAVSVDPPDYNDDTDPFKLIIGVEVGSLDYIPHEMEAFELSGTYASTTKKDDSTFGALIRWVNESGYELADTYSIELHDHTDKLISLMFPVVKRNA